MGYYIGNYSKFKVEADDIHISTSNNFTLAKVIYYKCDDKHTCVVDIVFVKHSCSKLEFSNKKEIMDKISHSDVVIQPFVKGAGKDVRVYVLGEEILACVCRTATSGFKSNFSLGGSVELYELSGKERQLVEKIISQFSFGLVGIDFLIDENGEFLFNEIEDVVGARMLYQLTDINLVGKYLEFIIERIG